jgi:hypothetical protein
MASKSDALRGEREKERPINVQTRTSHSCHLMGFACLFVISSSSTHTHVLNFNKLR